MTAALLAYYRESYAVLWASAFAQAFSTAHQPVSDTQDS